MIDANKIEEIEGIAAEAGFCEMKVVPSDRVVFLESVRLLLEDELKSYDIHSYSLPPYVPSYEECKERTKAYSHALLLSAIFPTADIADFSAWMEAGVELNGMIETLCDTLLEHELKVLPLGMRCRRCEVCACPDAPCRHPETMLFATESFGIHIMNTMEAEGITGYYDNQTIVCFGMVFVD